MNRINIQRVENLADIDTFIDEVKQPLVFLAGGTDLMVYCRRGDNPAPTWIDISFLKPLTEITDTGDTISIGALATPRQLHESALIQKYVPALAKAAGLIGSPLIRNRATIGGNLGNASPAGDTIPPLFVHRAKVNTHYKSQSKTLEINNLFAGPGQTVLRPGELITSIDVEKEPHIIGSFLKLGQRKSLQIAKVSIAVALILDHDIVKDIRIALGAVGPTVFRAYRTEALLQGKILHAKLLKKAQKEILKECNPIDDIRSTADYRREMVPILLERILQDEILHRFTNF
ncbi:FAD binding domain-containing protein [candidate division CSSED10-310 bacterium]|uniref:FAD binding domain-containing protein n=1 Tax=candidate division CSSED10-310 bacterium TaxID=2855610 RepID=A0ABV6YVF2_UNCC1